MPVIARDIVVSIGDTGGGIVDGNNPIIGWRNVVTPTTVSADSADPLKPALNLGNPATNLYWQSLSVAVQYVTVNAGSDPTDYLAIAKHNLGTVSAPVSVEAFLAGVWTQIVAPSMLADDSPVLFRWTAQSTPQLRLKMGAGMTAAPRIAVMYAGKLLVLQRRLYVGHVPMPFGRTSQVTNSRSESGQFLGRVVLSEARATSFTAQNMTPTFYRNEVDPFVVASKEIPFFFAWRPQSYPKEVGYGWMTNDPKPVNQRNNGMMSIDFAVGGVA